ncbi:MAG: hypothetical protein ACYDCN_08845 [Bacteroidia bacterium]
MKKRAHVNAIFYYSINVSQFLSDADAFFIVLGTAPANTFVIISTRDLAAARAAVVTARGAESNVSSRTRGVADARDLNIAPVVTYVQNFVLAVQTSANNAATVALATAGVTECLLHTKKPSTKHKDSFDFSNDATTPSLFDIAFKAAPKNVHACYECWLSLDNITFDFVKSSPDSRYTYAHGKPVGTKVYLKGRMVLSEKKGGEQAFIIPPEAFVFTK